MPDAIMIHFFFEHTGCSPERQANLLLRTGGKYDWKQIKEAVELLYANVTVNRNYVQRSNYGGNGRGRAAHEVHATEFGFDCVPSPEASTEQIEAWLQDYDPAEALADVDVDSLPEDLARELHTCFATHRENRQRLAKAVKNRGFYVADKGKGKKGKGSGKSKGATKGKGHKGSGKHGGKARGMSLDELKAVTTCAACEQVGHWRGDPQCPKRNANEATRDAQGDDAEGDPEDAGQWQEGEWSWDDDACEAWAAQRYGYSTARAAHVSARPSSAATGSAPSGVRKDYIDYSNDIRHKGRVVKELKVDKVDIEQRQVQKITRDINQVKSKLGQNSNISADDVRQQLEDEDVKRAALKIKQDMMKAKKPHVSASVAPSAVAAAVRHYGSETFDEVGTAWALLRDPTKGPDVETLRRSANVARRVADYYIDDDEEMVPEHYMTVKRNVELMMRRPPTVDPYRQYLTIDTACENTVMGSKIAAAMQRRWKDNFNLECKSMPEHEMYCFGPGEPTLSSQRLAVPINISGQYLLIQTSVVQDGDQTSVPFLAGQDWLLFVGAVIDVGASKLHLAKCGITADLEVDVTGHLAVAIDDFSDGFKPEDYRVQCQGYAGTIFSPLSPAQSDGNNDSSEHREMYMVSVSNNPEFDMKIPWVNQQVVSSPNFHYEPNDDMLNENGKITGLVRGPCTVSPDYWEFRYHEGMFIRHHCRPRRQLFHLRECIDGPEPHQLQQRKDFETPATKRQVTFQIPPQQFGSAVVEQRRQQLGSAHASRQPPASSSTRMAEDSVGDGAYVDGAAPLASKQSNGEGIQTSLTGSYGVYGGHDAQRDGGGNPSHSPAFDHTGLGTDSDGSDGAIPQQGGEVPARGGMCTATGERAWSFSGVPGMRACEKGIAGGLRGAKDEHQGARVQDPPRSSANSRRKSQQSRPNVVSRTGWIGRLLLALFAASIGTCFSPEGESQAEAEIWPILEQFQSNSGSAHCGQRGGGPELPGNVEPGDTVGLGASGHGDGWRPLSSGQRRRLKNQARKALAMSRVSKGVVTTRMSSSKWPRRKFNYDLIEIFGGTSMVSLRAGSTWCLKTLQPVDIRYGVDLRKRVCRRWLLRMLDKWNPRLAMVEFPCTPWSILQKNCNYVDDPEGLLALQECDRPFLRLTRDIFRSQVRRHGHAMAENPTTASSHQQPEILELRRFYYETTSCLCMFGLRGKKGNLMQKRVRFIATHKKLVDAVQAQCDHQHEHEKVEGSNTPASAAYPPDLADAICRALIEIKDEEDFGSVHTWEPYEPRRSYFVDIVKEEDAWRAVLPLVEEILARKVQNNIFLDPSTDLYGRIQKLLPWQIVNIQVAHLPKAKRVRPGLEKCHRASILLTNEDNLVIETEYLPDCQAPRERFISPIRYGIFVLGYAGGEPQEPSPAQPQPVQKIPESEEVEDPMVLELQQQGLVRQDFAGECWFIGPPLTHEQKKLARPLVRMHRNLGHPRQEDFTRALAQQDRLEPEVLALSRRLRCATCERTKRPLPPRPTSLKATPSFNTKLSLDIVFLHDSLGAKFQYLHVLDPAGGFNVFAILESRQPEHVLSVFNNIWLSWAGMPEYVRVDRDGAFEGSFYEHLVSCGIDVDAIPAEAHWQAGDVESYNRAFRNVANRIIDEHQLTGWADMQLLGSQVGASLNDKVRMSGASPNQWVFGKNPAIPGDLLNMDGKLRDEQLRHRQQVRARADALISEYRVQEALQKAVNRQSRPPRTRYEPGELVAFWRNAKRGKGNKLRQPGWFRGTIIGPQNGQPDGQQNNYWVSSNAKCILVSLEQLRPAFGTELWTVQEDDLQELENAMPDHYYDETGAGPLEEDQPVQHEEVVVPFFDSGDELPQEQRGASVSPTPTTPLETPEAHEVPVPEDEELLIEATDAPVEQGSVSQPLSAEASDHTIPHPSSPLAARGRAPGTPVQHLFAAPPPPAQPPDLFLPEAKRPRLDSGGEGEMLAAPDGPVHERTSSPSPEISSALCVALGLQPHLVHMCSVCDKRPSLAYLTRKEAKALEKEIPYHMIPEDQWQGYHDALVKEWNVWLKYEAVKVLSVEASNYVLENVDPSRILDARVCYRNKNAAFAWLPVKHKARIVCRGDNDPDLTSLRRDAPTLTRLGLMLILQIASSMSSWFLFNSDITGAFLQGDQSLASRKEALYLRQPREGLPGLLKGQIMLVVRGIFGLANSPRLFWRHLRDTLLRIGFRQSTLDRALFCYYKDQKLILVLGAHVDDLIGTGQPGAADQVLDEIKKQFDFGSWSDDRQDEVLEYGGKEIRRGPGGEVYLSQAKFIRATNVTPIPKWRSSTPNAPLMPKEMTELRSVGGCLHWLVGQTRPDLAAGTSLYMSGQPTVDSLQQLNKLLKEAKATEDWSLTFRPVPLETARIIVFSDASFANADGLRSQAGYLVYLAGENACSIEGDAASLLDWRSHKIKRQCRSTLAAETMSLDSAVDAGLFARELLAEILVQSYVPCQSGKLPSTFLPMTSATDCRSLYDLLTKDGPLAATQEKRLAIDLSALKETAAEFDEQLERLNDLYRWESALAMAHTRSRTTTITDHHNITDRHHGPTLMATAALTSNFSCLLAGQCSVPSSQCFMSWEARGF
eukprot:s2476_g6.t1